MATEHQWLNLIRLTMMLASDKPKGNTMANAVYLPGLSSGMVASAKLFQVCADLVINGQAQCVAFNGSDGEGMPPQDRPGAAWPGKKYYIRELTKVRVLNEKMMITRAGLHSRDEADALIELAQEQKWERLFFLSVAYHAPRAFACLVASMYKYNYWPDIFNFHLPSTDWYIEMEGSQGVEITTPFKECKKDVLKVFEYQEMFAEDSAHGGAPFDMIFDYLISRKR